MTVNLGDVGIGQPARVHIADLLVGTDFRALLSRRIEHASLRLTGARIELPLPPFKTGGSSDASSTGSPPVDLVSSWQARHASPECRKTSATTDDLRFESKDLLLAATGAIQLSAATVNLSGRLQLSDELSRQAGRDLVRYTQDQGRVTLPATITGSASALQVRLDVGDMAKRAVKNAATEEAQSAAISRSGNSRSARAC